MGRRSENGAAILDAATHTFWTKGYEGVGVNEICANAKINKGTLYHFYEDKQELILSVIERNSQFVSNYMATHAALPPLDRVLAQFDLMLETQKNEFEISGHVPGCPFGNLGAEMATRNEKIRLAIDLWFESMVNFISAAIAEYRGSTEGSQILADELFTHWQGAILRAKVANTLVPIDRARLYTTRCFKSFGNETYQ